MYIILVTGIDRTSDYFNVCRFKRIKLYFFLINAAISSFVCSSGIFILLYFIITYSDKERLAFIPAVYPLFHAQSRLKPPHFP